MEINTVAIRAILEYLAGCTVDKSESSTFSRDNTIYIVSPFCIDRLVPSDIYSNSLERSIALVHGIIWLSRCRPDSPSAEMVLVF